MKAKTSKYPKQKQILLVVLAIVATLVALLGIKSYIETPRDIGPELAYVGSENTGCPLPLPLGYLLLCSQEPGAKHYFATDMGEKQLQHYFTKAKLVDVRYKYSTSTPRQLENTELVFELDKDDFVVDLFARSTSDLHERRLKETSHSNLVSISDFDYQIARNAHND